MGWLLFGSVLERLGMMETWHGIEVVGQSISVHQSDCERRSTSRRTHCAGGPWPFPPGKRGRSGGVAARCGGSGPHRENHPPRAL